MRKIIKNKFSIISLCTLILLITLIESCNKNSIPGPIRIIAELNIGESQEIKLTNGDKVKLTLLEINEIRDSLRNAIRAAYVKVSVDGEEITLSAGNYNLPVVAGKVQIDCPSIRSFFPEIPGDRQGFSRDACFRLWPKGSSLSKQGTFVYPIRQKWFASMTQSGSEPTYVDWGENPANKRIYYHTGHDIGGAEGMDEVVAATDGLVVSANKDTLAGYSDFPGDIRTDVVYIKDDLGWFTRYSHLDSTDPAIVPGAKIKMGQRIGFIGKQGHSGGWVHLHFEISNKETITGNWATEDAYAYVLEAYVNQYKPALIAVARPHHLAWTGQEVILDGRKSKSLTGDIISYEWIFTNGTSATGVVQKKVYDMPGEYSEVLKVTDSNGNIDYDFSVVQVYNQQTPDKTIPTIQAAYHPTLNIKPGDPVTFLVRTFNTSVGNEVWDFGDGTPAVLVKSETVNRNEATKGKFAETVHLFSKPGNYVVSVERIDESGFKAITHLHVVVNL